MRRFFLLSIKPEYSERILAGEKTFELRKRSLGTRRGDIVLIYSSSPVQAVTGAFMALGELELPVSEMWRLHNDYLGIAKSDFDGYYAGAETATAIPIGRTVRIPSISLPELRTLRPGFTPPQSFMYCPEAFRSGSFLSACDRLIEAC